VQLAIGGARRSRRGWSARSRAACAATLVLLVACGRDSSPTAPSEVPAPCPSESAQPVGETTAPVESPPASTAVARTTVTNEPTVTADVAATTFPLHEAPGTRYLIDAAGRPFLMQGDSAWSMIGELDHDEVNQYLADRRRRGFNTILVSLLEHKFSRNAPANIFGDQPFTTPGDFATPNEAYFANADWVLQRAEEEGFLVLLTPAYIGYIGGDEGWYDDMVANGVDKMLDYGRYIGARYADRKNIVWVQGGDGDPPDQALIDGLAEGIAASDPGALQTVHANRDTEPLAKWPGRSWLAINNVYTYDAVYPRVLEQYELSDLPLFLIEAVYENETPGASLPEIRAQSYQAYFAGAMGQLFGNNPVWHFSGPGLEEPDSTWQEALDSPGARSMTVLGTLMRSLPWWMLVPDETDGRTLLVGGRGNGRTRAVATELCDGSKAFVYVPSSRTITLDLGAMTGSTVVMSWIDPTTGERRSTAPSDPSDAGRVTLRTPGGNAEGSDDWVLTLENG
jgi:hypothetical protein